MIFSGHTAGDHCYKNFFGGYLDFHRGEQNKNRPFKSRNNFRVKFSFEKALFSNFCSGPGIKTNIFGVLHFGESRFPTKMF